MRAATSAFGRISGSGPSPTCRAQRLLGAAELRHEPVRERKELRRRAVVLLEPDNARLRESPRQREQPLRARAREAVDRLIVVADRAEIVPVAEPEIEQRLLEQVHILVLVDRERPPPLAYELERMRIVFEHADRSLEQILEVERSGIRLSLLVLAEDAMREIGRQRRLVVAERRDVCLRRQPAVLRPFDLCRKIARRPELVRRRQPVADLPEEQRLRRENPPGVAGKAAQQRERGRVERRGPHALHAETGQPRAQLARGLVREGDGDERGRLERPACDLPGDPAGDRRRLARACAGENAHRPARRFDGGALFCVQSGKDSLGVQGRTTVAGGSAGFVPESWRTRSRFGWRTIDPSFATTSSVSPSSASSSSSISCCASQAGSIGARLSRRIFG